MFKKNIILNNFKSMGLSNQIEQAASINWLIQAHSMSTPLKSNSEKFEKLQRRIAMLGKSNHRVRSRNFALSDFTHTEWEKMKIFNLNENPRGKGSPERLAFYSEAVGEMFEHLYSEESQSPSILIHVTCTGYISPSGAQRLVGLKNWGQKTEVLHVYHMGCYASFPAIRIALGLLPYKSRRIDIVHTELCSLHLNPDEESTEQLIIQTLFSDGVIRYSVSDSSMENVQQGLQVVAMREEIVPQTEQDMAWKISDRGMQMKLSRNVPNIISKNIREFLERMAKDAGIELGLLQKHAIFAIHPGGPRIIDCIQELLRLFEWQVLASNKILEESGNMSSATLPYVWKNIVENPEISSDQWIVSVGFGPGLTISGGIFKKWLQK